MEMIHRVIMMRMMTEMKQADTEQNGEWYVVVTATPIGKAGVLVKSNL